MRTQLKHAVAILLSTCLFASTIAQSSEALSFSTADPIPELQHSLHTSSLSREASGLFKPKGPPNSPPIRIEAGESCIVDLTQAYIVSGTLSGSFEIDYRIVVHGPCT